MSALPEKYSCRLKPASTSADITKYPSRPCCAALVNAVNGVRVSFQLQSSRIIFVNSEISTFEAGEHEDVVVGVPKI